MADEVRRVSGDFATGGSQVAGYHLAEQIGWGGMAVVYRAYDARLGRWVALKILAPEIARDESFRRRFISESRAAAAVDHPHIIPVFEAGESGGALFIAMRYVGGGDVGTLVRRAGPLDAARTCGIIAQVASALDAAHAAGLVHRDVKPANMLLATVAGSGQPDHVYLSDFGLSKQALSTTTDPNLAGQFAGTLDYMAPEQIESRPVDGRTDLYALACAAFEMLSGEPPFRRGQDLGLLRGQVAEAPRQMTSLRPDLPPEIGRVLARALARSPDDRYQRCLDFAAALTQASGFEWSATGQLLAGPPGAATQLAAPLLAAGPAASRDSADGPAVTHDQVAGPRWSPAPPLIAALPPAGAARMSDHAGPITAEAGLAGPGLAGPGLAGPGLAGPGLAGLGLAADGPDGPGQDWLEPDGTGPYPPAPRGRSPVIAAAVFVVILAVAGAAFLALRGGGGSPAKHAASALPSAATSPSQLRHSGNSGTPGNAANPGGSAGPSGATSPGSATSPGGTTSPGGATSQRRPASPAGPAATVRAYIAAINGHHFARAWKLGGRAGSPSYPAFVQGFGTTAKDTLIIVSVRGDVVTARLVALQADGTFKTYQGTYIVDNGVITKSDVAQVG